MTQETLEKAYENWTYKQPPPPPPPRRIKEGREYPEPKPRPTTPPKPRESTDNDLDTLLGNVNYNKAYAVGQYVNGLGLSIAEMMRRGDHTQYAWDSGRQNNPHRQEMLEAIHKKAMEAINLLEEYNRSDDVRVDLTCKDLNS